MEPRLKKSAASRRESAFIGARLRYVREAQEISQQRAAQELGLSREQYVNYELARTPIKTRHALDFCLCFVVSEHWLATGDGEKRRFMNLRQDAIFIANEGALPLSEAYKITLPEMAFADSYPVILANRYAELAAAHPFGIRIPNLESAVDYRDLLTLYLQMWDMWLSQEAELGLAQALVKAGNDYCASLAKPDFPLPVSEIVPQHESFGLPVCSGEVFEAWKKQILSKARAAKSTAKADKHKAPKARKK